MAKVKEINGRIINKHDIEVNWNKASTFIPEQGEIIIYDIDENYNFERFKIGDGITNVINLPFTNIELDTTLLVEGKAADAKAVGDALATKQPTGDYALKNELPVVPTNVSAFTNDKGYLTAVPGEYVTETELTNKGYLTSYTETDPTVPAWAKASTKPTYTASEIGLSTENWTFTLEDGSTITKVGYVG